MKSMAIAQLQTAGSSEKCLKVLGTHCPIRKLCRTLNERIGGGSCLINWVLILQGPRSPPVGFTRRSLSIREFS